MFRIIMAAISKPRNSGKAASKRRASRGKSVSAESKNEAIVVPEKATLLLQSDCDDVFESIIKPTNNIGLILQPFDGKGLSELLVVADERFTVATCEKAAYQFMHCIVELTLEAFENQDGESMNKIGSVKLIHDLKSDFVANKHQLRRGAIVQQNLNAGQARKHHAEKAVERFDAKV